MIFPRDELDALIQEYEGWVCVPREPTKAVIDAIADAHDDRGIVDRLSAWELYDLVLAAAEQKD